MNYWSRDHSRTPMQWSDGENAGFTDGEPWIALNENYPEINVERARENEESVWHHYRELIELRHGNDVLVYGEYDLLLPDDERIYAYMRTLADETWLVVLNWSAEPATFASSAVETGDAEAVIANHDDPPADPSRGELRPYEAVGYRLR